MEEYLFGHIGDAYEWHLFTLNGKEIAIPLPCIIIDRGVHVFSAEKLAHGAEYNGYKIAPKGAQNEGKIVRAADGSRPFDISITKNVCSLIISIIILLWLFLKVAKQYKQRENKAPHGAQGLVEPLILFIRDEVAIPSLGDKYEKYFPYLLTLFFFILVNNLMGLIPIFPGGANVTGNIAITGILAVALLRKLGRLKDGDDPAILGSQI